MEIPGAAGNSMRPQEVTLQQRTISDLMDERWKTRAETVQIMTKLQDGIDDLKAFLDKTVPSPVSD